MLKRKGDDLGKGKNRRYLIGQVKQVVTPNFVMSPAELRDYLPEGAKFNVKRAYWITKAQGEMRSGQHAHTNEDEIFIILDGEVDIILDDNGKRKRRVHLKTNNLIWVPRYIWHGFDKIGKDCIVLALSNTNYDPERKGYIEDYQKFRERIKDK